MATSFDLDATLFGRPSVRAIKAFLASTKYKSLTSAAKALSLTPAAFSKQVRELEDYLGTEQFVRSDREVTLTADGGMFKDVAQLSLINILQAANRLRMRVSAPPALVHSLPMASGAIPTYML